MTELPKQYDPKDHEEAIYKEWEEAGVFQPSEEALRAGKNPFVIMLPPPNITGSLHMGHALQDVIMDILSRWHRMLGDPVLWLPGTDHAAIATNRVLEKKLQAEGTTRQEIGREEFLRRAEAWYEEVGAIIIGQMKRLGCSCDWSRQRFTMDEHYYQAVQETFVRYYERGYIYRGNRMVNWCPRCQSVVSDLEISHTERTTQLVTIRYPFANGEGAIEVATTRPETMLGDTAVAVHPDDARYKDVIGTMVRLPLVGREIPVIADERIDPSFGTGAVKVTPAHDPLDAQIGETHKLPVINVIGEAGRMTEAAGEFAGLTVEEARQKVVIALREQELIVSETDHKHSVSLCERCGSVIEPLVSRQWFVDMSKLKDETIDVAEKELVKFVPPRWQEHFLEWMRGVHDWTISRQIWLGHRIPVWWKAGARGTENEAGNFVVSLAKPTGEFEQDPDVLDTWFSSALWPFATLGWPQNTEDLQTFYPTSVLVTARDILYLWVARMMFSGLELMKGEEYGNHSQAERIPFRDVFIYPTVLAKSGQRMSKSLGTGVDPLELIDKYGADATRFGLMHQLTFDSQAMKFDEEGIRAARNFGNKLWNIARLLQAVEERTERSLADDWIEWRAAHVTQEVGELLQGYKIGEAARLLHDFVWKDFADWYLEILKTTGSTQVAHHIFRQALQLLHPFVPHITEVLWRQLGGEGMVAVSQWPAFAEGSGEAKPRDENTESQIARFQDIVNTTRSARILLGIKPGSSISLHVEGEVPLAAALQAMARVTLTSEASAAMRRMPLKGGGTIGIASDEITPERLAVAQQKLEKERASLQHLIESQSSVLAQMQGKAPAEKIAEKEEVVRASTERLQEVDQSLKLLAGI